MRNRLTLPLALLARSLLGLVPSLLPSLFVAACGGGGGGSSPASTVSGTVTVLSASPFRARVLAETEIYAGQTSVAVDGSRVLRVLAQADGSVALHPENEGARDIEACLHNLDSGACGRVVDAMAGDAIDIVLTGRGHYRFRLDHGATGADSTGSIPESYWAADDHRPGEIVVAPGPGWDAERIAAFFGLDCLADSEELCLLRVPSSLADLDPDARRRLSKLLARCARMVESGAARFAEPNFERRLTAVPNDPLLSQQWALEQVRVQGLWDEGAASDDAIVAIVDSGIVPHPDLIDRLVPGWDFLGKDDDPTDPSTSNAHGTMVSGIAAAATNNGAGVSGAMWGGRIMPLRTFSSRGIADVFGIAQAIRYAAGLSNSSGRLPAKRALVVNLSFAGAVRTQSEQDACSAARAAGTLPVAAAGNDGLAAARYPAAYDSVLGVAATTRAGIRASYSSFGAWISLAAPGGTHTDGLLVPDVDGAGGFFYRRISGSSFSAPHVAGIAAMLMDLGAASPDEVQSLMEMTARDVGSLGRDDDTGYGIVDAYAASLSLLQRPMPVVIPGEAIQIRLIRVSDGAEIQRVMTSELQSLRWNLGVIAPGRYRLQAGTDRNFDDAINDSGELFGEWQEGGELLIEVGRPRRDLSITIVPRS